MRYLVLFILYFNCLQAHSQETPGYPGSNVQSLISLPDMFSILPLYGQLFMASHNDLNNDHEVQSLYLSGDTLNINPSGGIQSLYPSGDTLNINPSSQYAYLEDLKLYGNGVTDFNSESESEVILIYGSRF